MRGGLVGTSGCSVKPIRSRYCKQGSDENADPGEGDYGLYDEPFLDPLKGL